MVQAEQRFIERFVQRNRRERLALELSSHRRHKGLGRFACAAKILIASHLHPYALRDVETLYADMLALGCEKEDAHIMSTAWPADNRMSLLDALRQAVYGGTLLVVAKDAAAVYFEDEPDYASHKFLLYQHSKFSWNGEI